ncbi:MAG: bifunctional glutamate N-acetyltransferase/amino-acid acetyltransferase ArgJ [Proteobacteria bacterium]|nr:bifunctional glutamate N-acetyltransferase/amino-acid acetyltransferase ArgJ [Pseudomonadota bacterium]
MEILDSPGCPGFSAAGVAAGLKKKAGVPDLGLIVCDAPAAAAGVFTKNVVQAAPVLLDRERVASGRCRAVLANSGCANCCTGQAGMDAARESSAAVARALGVGEEEVLLASTGVIGLPLNAVKVATAVPGLATALSPDGFPDFARAIMTTDTVPKLRAVRVFATSGPITVLGVVKGSGMIRPDMATMLGFLCTDARVSPAALKDILVQGADQSFNRLTVDGDTSTNDTLLFLASGRSPVPEREALGLLSEAAFFLMRELALDMARDGEGATKLVIIKVRGCENGQAARQVADTIANSPLVKTAFFGEDANWGRILAAAGRAGVPFDPSKTAIFFDDAQMVARGFGLGPEAEAAATLVLKKPEYTVTVDLGNGPGQAEAFTCDISLDYVRINADYRS